MSAGDFDELQQAHSYGNRFLPPGAERLCKPVKPTTTHKLRRRETTVLEQGKLYSQAPPHQPAPSPHCVLIILITFPSFICVFVLSLAIGIWYSIPPLSISSHLPSLFLLHWLSLSHPLLFTVTLTVVDAEVTHVEATLLGAHLPS